MDNKNEIFDDIEIIDDDFNETTPNSDELINDDWLSDFTNVETANDQPAEEIIELETIIDNLDEPTTEANNQNSFIDEEPVLETEDATKILNSIEITDPNSNVNFQTAPIDETEQTKEMNEEEELNNNRSVMFIAILFGILILFVILLPTVTQIIGK